MDMFRHNGIMALMEQGLGISARRAQCYARASSIRNVTGSTLIITGSWQKAQRFVQQIHYLGTYNNR